MDTLENSDAVPTDEDSDIPFSIELGAPTLKVRVEADYRNDELEGKYEVREVRR